MSDIKWIKITTDMFEDEKIDFISSLPDADSIIVIWIRILALAGKCNAGGYILLTEKIPYTDEMLAHKFKKPLNTVKMALETFQRLDMICKDGQALFLPKWEKHQNVDGMEKIRKQTNERVRKHREKAKQLTQCNVTEALPQRRSNATDIEEELDKEINTTTTDAFALQDEYAKLHGTFTMHIRQKEIMAMNELLKQIPLDFIVSTMKELHAEKEQENESVSSFLYYPEAIKRKWKEQMKPKAVARGGGGDGKYRTSTKGFGNTGRNQAASTSMQDEWDGVRGSPKRA